MRYDRLEDKRLPALLLRCDCRCPLANESLCVESRTIIAELFRCCVSCARRLSKYLSRPRLPHAFRGTHPCASRTASTSTASITTTKAETAQALQRRDAQKESRGFRSSRQCTVQTHTTSSQRRQGGSSKAVCLQRTNTRPASAPSDRHQPEVNQKSMRACGREPERPSVVVVVVRKESEREARRD